MATIAKNPILPGFYPDPTICAVGDDFYVVNSTFCYFPGLPVLHSRDLAHWEQIGNVLDRKSQLETIGCELSAGLYAPTMRYHEGTFYVICTNVSRGGNFIVKATNPAGPWSDPVYFPELDGIDPSLFFDDDGRCYYIGTHENPEGAKYNGDWYIFIQEIDLKEMKTIGEHKNVWNGSQKMVIWPEGPHIYKENGYYYIMHAEGGTGPDHAVAVCRSRDIWGPYQNNPCNPILTHRHFGADYRIRYVGHGDLAKTVNGEWFMVMLAVRQTEGYTTMGRETFLAKVTWENDWPVVNAGYGMLTDTLEIDLPEWIPEGMQVNLNQRIYSFDKMEKLGHEFLFLRDKEAMRYELTSEGLKLGFSPYTLKQDMTETYACIRQQHKKFSLSADFIKPELEDGKTAGLALLQNQLYHVRVELTGKNGMLHLSVIGSRRGEDALLGNAVIKEKDKITLFLQVDGLKAKAGYRNGKEEVVLTENIDVRELSTEVAGGFVGCTMGLYAAWEDMPKGAPDKVCIKEMRYEAE